MAWTKVTRDTISTGDGFLEGSGFLVQGFLAGTGEGGDWVKVTRDED